MLLQHGQECEAAREVVSRPVVHGQRDGARVDLCVEAPLHVGVRGRQEAPADPGQELVREKRENGAQHEVVTAGLRVVQADESLERVERQGDDRGEEAKEHAERGGSGGAPHFDVCVPVGVCACCGKA